MRSRPAPPKILLTAAPGNPNPRSSGSALAADDRRPCFTSTWLEAGLAPCGKTLSEYKVNGVRVRISTVTGETGLRYELSPPEYDMNPSLVKVVAEAIEEMTALPPDDIDMRALSALRPYVEGVAKDLIHARLRSHRTSRDETPTVEVLARLASKYTVGYGVLDTMFEDPAVQDVYVNAPSSQTPVFVVLRSGVHSGVGQKCRTNVFVGSQDMLRLVSRVRLETGLPFSEAHPVLETDIQRLGCRMTLVGPPISVQGVSLAVRKHSPEALTLPSLVAFDTLSPLLASFLWACVIGRRTVLVAGSRGAGKTTLLGAMMLEFPLTQRILLIEDTPEIPAARMRELGYDIQALRFDGQEGGAVSAEEALKVSLRMGESAIVIGEVRGSEAHILYESMRAGSAGSSVLGTIHGNSAKGVVDRAVEDLGVTERAFSSTDIVVVIGMVRSPDGSAFERKIVEVSEVAYSHGAIDLVKLFEMGPGNHCAVPSDEFSKSSRTVRGIAEALGIPAEEVVDVVRRRAHCDQRMAQELSPAATGVLRRTDILRVQSNEMLVKGLFGPDGVDAIMRSWGHWYEHRAKDSS